MLGKEEMEQTLILNLFRVLTTPKSPGRRCPVAGVGLDAPDNPKQAWKTHSWLFLSFKTSFSPFYFHFLRSPAGG